MTNESLVIAAALGLAVVVGTSAQCCAQSQATIQKLRSAQKTAVDVRVGNQTHQLRVTKSGDVIHRFLPAYPQWASVTKYWNNPGKMGLRSRAKIIDAVADRQGTLHVVVCSERGRLLHQARYTHGGWSRWCGLEQVLHGTPKLAGVNVRLTKRGVKVSSYTIDFLDMKPGMSLDILKLQLKAKVEMNLLVRELSTTGTSRGWLPWDPKIVERFKTSSKKTVDLWPILFLLL